ncbi:MAG TPA: YtxH domain-containing protein [Thermoanaerobaculia bacterium]|nr:YtxH domain-containing protein [Thermoanaerobaculia bacterium]
MFSRKQKFPLGKVATSFGIGAFAGAIVALLYAPTTGKKMQKKLAKVSEDLLEKVEDKVEDVQATVRKIARA